jgi:hypothetical protein
MASEKKREENLNVCRKEMKLLLPLFGHNFGWQVAHSLG